MSNQSGFPWVKAGLGILALLAVLKISAGLRGSESTAAANDGEELPAAPTYRVKVVSISCEPNYGRARSEVTIRNEGSEIPYLTVFVSFGPATQKGYFQPSTVPSGAMAEATLYAAEGIKATGCTIAQMQDGDGRPVTLSK